jgi:hypothetical protein
VVVRLEYNPKFLNVGLVPKGSKYSTFPGPQGCHFDVALTIGATYIFTLGQTNDLGLWDGGQHLVAPGTFIAQTNTANLIGAPSAIVGSQLYKDPGHVVNGMIKDLIGAVIEADPDNGGVRFGLAPDAFELVTFDDGLVAYHIRFSRFAVFGF